MTTTAATSHRKSLSRTGRAKALKPICLGLVVDVAHKPSLTLEHLDAILSICRRRGGIVAITTVDCIAKPALHVAVERVQGGISAKLGRLWRNEMAISKWRQQARDRVLNKQHHHFRRDILGSITRLSVFFSEHPASVKAMLLSTDCTHTGPERPLPSLPRGVLILSVGSPNVGEISFPSFTPTIEFLENWEESK